MNNDMDMETLLSLCQSNDWRRLMQCVVKNPSLALTVLKMKNKLTTTILHQAISARGHVEARAETVETILKVQPLAASLPNGYGSLPLHVIMQRNTNMDSSTKERLIMALIDTYPEALVKKGGLRERTPLHIAFTDYISPKIIAWLIERGPSAAFMPDKEGWLPIHVACSRHCSPEKLELLLAVNPSCLHARTNNGESPQSLARTTATKAHPNLLLLQDIKMRLGNTTPPPASPVASFNIENLPDNGKKKRTRASKRRAITPVSAARGDDGAELLLHFHKQANVASSSPFRPHHEDSLRDVIPYPV